MSRASGPMAAGLAGLAGVAGLLGLVPLAGCPSDATNPPVLWLATPNGDELHVLLVESEPPPF